jgi:phosphohistidine phosphatase
MASSPARRLILLRHAKSAWPDVVADHERPLARRGQRDAPVMGRWLRKSGCVPDLVLCSTAQRARETWQLAEERLGTHPRTSFEPRVYEATATELLHLARKTAAAVGILMIVGHEPAMRNLTLELTSAQPGGDGGVALERVREKFPTGAIAVLSLTGSWQELGPGQTRLTEFVAPSDLRAEHGKG